MQKDLDLFADEIRYLTLRELSNIGYGHFGGSLSIVEALAVLYGGGLRLDPKNPQWEGRDYFVLSKGHAGPALYATLAATGFIPLSELWTLNANGTNLPSHPDRQKITGVEMTTGSMGQGVSVASGLAYGLQASGRSNRVVALVGDGELNEGQCWEAAQFIAARNLTNMVVMVDYNKQQLDGWVDDVGGKANFVEKFTAFGFRTSMVDGHHPAAIKAVLDQAWSSDIPVCIVLDTTKGRGVELIEEADGNHHVRLDDTSKQAVVEAMEKLRVRLAEGGIVHE